MAYQSFDDWTDTADQDRWVDEGWHQSDSADRERERLRYGHDDEDIPFLQHNAVAYIPSFHERLHGRRHIEWLDRMRYRRLHPEHHRATQHHIRRSRLRARLQPFIRRARLRRFMSMIRRRPRAPYNRARRSFRRFRIRTRRRRRR